MTLLDFQLLTLLSFQQLLALTPWMLLALGGLMMLGVDVFLPKIQTPSQQGWKKILSMLLFGGVGVASWLLYLGSGQDIWVFGRSLQVSPMSLFTTCMLSVLGVGTVALTHPRQTHNASSAEYYSLLFFSVLGMGLMVASADLIMLFTSLELMSLCIYLLIAAQPGRPFQAEGSLKYFLLGAMASAFLLMGIALIYGSVGTVLYSDILEMEAGFHPSLLTLGIILFSVGVFFKFGLVPFHMYLPDAYQAAPSPITLFMAIGVKVAIFLAALRFLLVVSQPDPLLIYSIMYPLIMVSVLVGNLIALRQSNVKRMLAYSSIAHAGYIAIGLLPLSLKNEWVWFDSVQAIVLYLVTYALAILGVFALVCLAEDYFGEDQLTFDHFRGFAQYSPLASFLFLILFVSLAGLPVSAGFIGKYLVFANAIRAGEVWITLAAIVGSMISIYYYFKIPVNAFLVSPESGSSGTLMRKSWSWHWVIAGICGFLTLLIGILPQIWMNVLSRAVFEGM
jgi:NADH-quinone oxidoreductase subunit N